jgi:hypothetical protein
MVIMDLIADFIAPVPAILLPLLTVLNAVRAVLSNGPIANTRSFAYTRTFTYTGSFAYTRSFANAGTFTSTRTLAGRGQCSRACPRAAQEFGSRAAGCAARHCACQIAGTGSRGGKRAGPTSAARRLDVQEVLQLAG